jgi:diphthine-ammonia ligase
LRVGALFSGGKDSTYAAYLASMKHQLSCLITIFPPNDMSYMFHFPNLEWTNLQAEAMGVPQVVEATTGVKEEELVDLRRAIDTAKSDYELEAVYTGALASVYQKDRVEKVCAELRLQCISPLWHLDPKVHWENLLSDGFAVVVSSVSALGLDEAWLGRVIDASAVEELVELGAKYRFHIGFEGGEGETFVLDCPLFSKKVEILSSLKHWKGDSGYLEIADARLAEKPNRKAAAV